MARMRVFILRGGMFGWDGPVVSRGMDQLGKLINELPNVSVYIYNWSQYAKVIGIIKNLAPADKVTLVGYSGGGSRATWIANYVYPTRIELMVVYDPSPITAMMPLRSNVERAVCYWNEHPLMLDLGGGWIKASSSTQLVTKKISEQHLAVQYDQDLHRQTVDEIRKISDFA